MTATTAPHRTGGAPSPASEDEAELRRLVDEIAPGALPVDLGGTFDTARSAR